MMKKIAIKLCNDGFVIIITVLLYYGGLITRSFKEIEFIIDYNMVSIFIVMICATLLMLPHQLEGKCILSVLKRCIISDDYKILFRSYKNKILPTTIIIYSVSVINAIISWFVQ